jgi:hypothetical protein
MNIKKLGIGPQMRPKKSFIEEKEVLVENLTCNCPNVF